MGAANGAIVTVPQGALDDEVTIVVEETSDYPEDTDVVASPVWRFKPEGLVFKKPVSVTIALEPGVYRDDLAFFWSRSDAPGAYEIVANAVVGENAGSAGISHFSSGFIGTGNASACSQRYEKTGSSVRDKKTGLNWFRQDVFLGPTFIEAENACANSTVDGYTDWRLPTVQEFMEYARGCGQRNQFGNYWCCLPHGFDGCSDKPEWWTSSPGDASGERLVMTFGECPWATYSHAVGNELSVISAGSDFTCVRGETVQCERDCSGRVCGPDPVCGESCGTCTGGKTCNSSGQCVAEACVPNCSGRECGADPTCGESCGTCTGGKTCNSSGQCVSEACVPNCSGRECGPDPVCGESCGTCTGTDTCNDAGQCVPTGCVENCEEMVTVPAGPFMQGCNGSVDTQCTSDEEPYHEVNVPAFEIDKYEVTVDLYGDCVTGGGCTASTGTSSYCNQGKSGKSDHPMNCITWYQAREYCAWAGKRLCSESEWEKASRGTDGRKYPWGNETATCDYAVMNDGGDGCGTDSTWPVGSKPAGASPYGALDMSGNLWEWVEDDYHSNYTGAPTNGSAWVDDPRSSYRVVRGGSFGYDVDYLRSSHRYGYDPAAFDVLIGVRCCRSK